MTAVYSGDSLIEGAYPCISHTLIRLAVRSVLSAASLAFLVISIGRMETVI